MIPASLASVFAVSGVAMSVVAVSAVTKDSQA
jgi:hypothetical protein